MKAKHLLIGAAAVALLAIFINDLVNKDANALELVNDRVGLKVNCSIEKVDGRRWGACRYSANNAPASAWLKRGDMWVAGNGAAMEVINRMGTGADLQNLPNIMTDYQNPPTMPDELFAQ
ncbi:hypothetical protein [Pseudomonas viridiflava]|uniref:hypothetical protein n=1 Tax=Pseudomonas viridiflava TaxID=33069 RepID=UPI000F03019E|nr:hypothetical protein [Pseudomonas viridiflava]